MNVRTLKPKLTGAGIAIAMAAAPAATLAAASTANWQIPLKASASYPKAAGSAQYQSQPGQREIQIEVQHIPSMAGKTVIFSAAGITLGHAKVSRGGAGGHHPQHRAASAGPADLPRLARDSPDGQRRADRLRPVLTAAADRASAAARANAGVRSPAPSLARAIGWIIALRRGERP